MANNLFHKFLYLMLLTVLAVNVGCIQPSKPNDVSVFDASRVDVTRHIDCSGYMELGLCLDRINENSVEVDNAAFTWVSFPQTLYVLVATVVGCEAQASWETVSINRHDWPHIHFGMVCNGMEIAETTYQTIQLSPGCNTTGRVVQVELYSVRSGITRQELVVSNRR